jgi:hypothetical protein
MGAVILFFPVVKLLELVLTIALLWKTKAVLASWAPVKSLPLVVVLLSEDSVGLS